MDWGSGMHLARISENHEMKKSGTMAAPDGCGLVGWVLDLLRSSRGQREVRQKQMRLVETLALGGKKQLMLVTCAGESFLVGGGLESVETIVRLKKDVSVDEVEKTLDESCR
jgi:flagellar biogenesis protein FliO